MSIMPGDREIQLSGDVLGRYGLQDAPGPDVVFDRLACEFADEGHRQEIFRRLSAARDGPGTLVEMRRELLQRLGDHESWAPVDRDLMQALQSVFNRGLLEFRRMDSNTPIPVLNKLIQYEGVHQIHGWRDLWRRLESDRRCYAFFHPAWPDEPLAFTEVALTRGMSPRLQPLLNPESPVLAADSCDCAMFYSITNCHGGLRGFAFGGELICRVVETLRTELPRLETFATLSPIPGFRPWLSDLAKSRDGLSEIATVVAKLDASGWSENAQAAGDLERELIPLCALYLLHVKERAEPADSVARFHLANGARLRRVNWLSDVSAAGMRRSAGLTANYLYRPTDLEGNARAYASHREVKATPRLEQLARRADRSHPHTVRQVNA